MTIQSLIFTRWDLFVNSLPAELKMTIWLSKTIELSDSRVILKYTDVLRDNANRINSNASYLAGLLTGMIGHNLTIHGQVE